MSTRTTVNQQKICYRKKKKLPKRTTTILWLSRGPPGGLLTTVNYKNPHFHLLTYLLTYLLIYLLYFFLDVFPANGTTAVIVLSRNHSFIIHHHIIIYVNEHLHYEFEARKAHIHRSTALLCNIFA